MAFRDIICILAILIALLAEEILHLFKFITVAEGESKVDEIINFVPVIFPTGFCIQVTKSLAGLVKG